MSNLSEKENRVPRNSVLDDMYRAGASNKSISEAVGMTINSVSCILRRRIKKGLLEKRRNVCSICRRPGHNSVTCSNVAV